MKSLHTNCRNQPIKILLKYPKFFNQQMGTYSIKLWVPVYFTIQSLLAKKTRLLCTKQKAGEQQAGYRALHCRSFRKHINFIINDKLFGKIATPQSSFSVNSLPHMQIIQVIRLWTIKLYIHLLYIKIIGWKVMTPLVGKKMQ